MLTDQAALIALYNQLNEEYFESKLPLCQIRWSHRLTRSAGNIDVHAPLMKLSWQLLIDAFVSSTLFAPTYEICGVPCDSSATAVREIMKHEMIHLWLHQRKMPCGHTAAFRAKARQMGQPQTHHQISVPLPRRGWLYSCPACKNTFTRRRRFGRAVACASCCNKHSGGKFDRRFQLRGQQIKD